MASPERLYQEEKKGNVLQKLAKWAFVGVGGIIVAIIALNTLAGLELPTTPNAPFLQAA